MPLVSRTKEPACNCSSSFREDYCSENSEINSKTCWDNCRRICWFAAGVSGASPCPQPPAACTPGSPSPPRFRTSHAPTGGASAPPRRRCSRRPAHLRRSTHSTNGRRGRRRCESARSANHIPSQAQVIHKHHTRIGGEMRRRIAGVIWWRQ